MPGQVAGMGGLAVLGQVLRRGAEQVLDGQQLAAHQSGRRPVGDANGQVDVLVDQIDIAVFQQQLHVHRRIAAQEVGHVRMDHRAAHRLGHR